MGGDRKVLQNPEPYNPESLTPAIHPRHPHRWLGITIPFLAGLGLRRMSQHAGESRNSQVSRASDLTIRK